MTEYKYEIFTDPYDPEIEYYYNDFIKLIKKSNIINKLVEPLDNGIEHHIYTIITDENRLNKIDRLVNKIKYTPLTYSVSNVKINTGKDINSLRETIKTYLNDHFYADIFYIDMMSIDDINIFTAYDKDMYPIYVNPRVFSRIKEIKYEDIKSYITPSQDPLIPYISKDIDNKVNFKDDMFLIENTDIGIINETLLRYREEGYITIPTKNYHMEKYDINVAAEYLSEHNADIKRIDPYLVAKITSNVINVDSFILRNMQLNNDVPSINLTASPEWVIKTREFDKDNTRMLLELYYSTVVSYIKLLEKYPILNNQLNKIKLINVHTVRLNFANSEQLNTFINIWKKKLKYTSQITYIPFNNINNALAYRHKIDNSIIIDTDQINNNNTDDIIYYVVFDTPKGSKLPDRRKIDIIRNEIINQFIEYHKQFIKYDNMINNNNNNNGNGNKTLEELLSYYLYGDNLYSLSSFKEVIDGIYTIDNKIYDYSYAIKNSNLMLYGYFTSTSGFSKGLMEKIPGRAIIDMSTTGQLLMNKYKLDDINILYSFNIAINSSDYYIPSNNSELKDNNENIYNINRRNELKLVNRYRQDLAKISTSYLPKDDPGYKIKLFNLILPNNAYDDKSIYEYISKIWKYGYLLSEWAKYIYIKHNKISRKQLVIPEILTYCESIEDSLKFIELFRDLL